MKLRNLTCLVASATVAMFTDMAYALTIIEVCRSVDDCWRYTSASYCCPNGNTGTHAVCPDGWTMSSGTCTRASEDAGEDEKGYMEKQYGGCVPTEETYSCYVGSDSSEVTIDGYTARCVKNPEFTIQPEL